jgi:hypothetical protein
MNYQEHMILLQQPSKTQQIEFYERVLCNIPIEIRSVFEDKVETIKWINEFNNSISGLIFSRLKLYPDIDIIDSIFSDSKLYASQSTIAQKIIW